MRPGRLLSGRGCRLLSKMTGKGSMHVESCWWWYCSDPRRYPVRFRADILDRGRSWGQLGDLLPTPSSNRLPWYLPELHTVPGPIWYGVLLQLSSWIY